MDFLNSIFKFKDQGTVCGLCGELQILYYLTYFNNYDDNVLIVTNSLYDSNKIYQKLKTYTDDVFLFPMDDFLASVAVALSPDLKVKRLEVLERIKSNKKAIIVTNLMGYLRYLPSKKDQDKNIIKLSINNEYNREELIDKLIDLGYKQTSLVTSTGEYALRGYIIDIFPIEADHPIRIEFFGDEIDSIRLFNESTQLSLDKIDEYLILPFQEVISDEHNSLYDYLSNPNVFYVDYNQILNGYNKICDDIKQFKESKHIENEYKYMYEFD
ncbi:MAG: hypothetical protein K6C11_03585, partial [Bacilli bacterium]|nr:hypothetical protein [Bacilli bacterium]